MPELPEVETICCSVQSVTQQMVQRVIVRQPQLRFAVPANLSQGLKKATIHTVTRRGKYLLFATDKGTLLMHFGMSGRLRLYRQPLPPAEKHDHVDIVTDTLALRFTDPRRFGAVLWTTRDPMKHRLLASLGPEPLAVDFNAEYLYQIAQGKRIAIKKLIMDSKVVVGVGNIYAAEALFKAKLHPERLSGDMNKRQCRQLVKAIQDVLATAIDCGGTTLKDFQDGNGDIGYFSQQLNVYGRDKQPCLYCKTRLEKTIIAQRSTVFCPRCQNSQGHT